MFYAIITLSTSVEVVKQEQNMKAVIYTRVSTAKQGKSKLGLKAQLRECKTFCNKENIEIIGYEQDIESGANDDRVGLNRAIKLAQQNEAVVMVNRLDRLSRDLHFISGLVKYNVPFCITQLGKSVPTMVIYQYALFSQLEREMIGSRIKAALKETNKPLGSANPTINAAATRGRKLAGNKTFWRIFPHIQEAQQAGHISLTDIKRFLDANGVLSARGKSISLMSIKRILEKHQS